MLLSCYKNIDRLANMSFQNMRAKTLKFSYFFIKMLVTLHHDEILLLERNRKKSSKRLI